MIEIKLKPALKIKCEKIFESIEKDENLVRKHSNRLAIVREQKKQRYDGWLDAGENSKFFNHFLFNFFSSFIEIRVSYHLVSYRFVSYRCVSYR